MGKQDEIGILREQLLNNGWTEEGLDKYGIKPVVGFEGLYSVTSCGKVWSHKRNKWLEGSISKDGYPRVSLQKDRKAYTIERHRLVAMAYINNPNDFPEVNHKTEDKTKNYVNGLEWCTHQYNMNYGTCTERARESRRKSGAYNKTPRRLIGGMSVKEVSEKTGKPIQTIYWQLNHNWPEDKILNK